MTNASFFLRSEKWVAPAELTVAAVTYLLTSCPSSDALARSYPELTWIRTERYFPPFRTHQDIFRQQIGPRFFTHANDSLTSLSNAKVDEFATPFFLQWLPRLLHIFSTRKSPPPNLAPFSRFFLIFLLLFLENPRWVRRFFPATAQKT